VPSVGCIKSPTISEKREQIIITSTISENTTWESGKDYVVEGEVVQKSGLRI